MNTIKTGYHGSSDIRDIRYTYDKLNNVTSKDDLKQNIFQSYLFDDLNRVIQSSTLQDNTTSTVNYTYDSLGNITYKSDISQETFVYQKAHQLKSTGNITYTYDANGNVIQKNKNGKAITLEYNANNKPTLIQDDTNKTEFFYAPNQARYKKVLNGLSTFYVGKHYELENVQDAVLQKNYIYAGNDLVAIHIQEDDGNMVLPQNRYLHKDALGSIDTITNESGVVIQRLAYGAFGKQLVQSWINEKDKNKSLVKRGYTGHEHISEFEFIHMNGRVYDVDTARFLSADPNIFHPFDTQNFNRYSYVMNNPLMYTDPSGFDAMTESEHDEEWGTAEDYGSGDSDSIKTTNTNFSERINKLKEKLGRADAYMEITKSSTPKNIETAEDRWDRQENIMDGLDRYDEVSYSGNVYDNNGGTNQATGIANKEVNKKLGELTQTQKNDKRTARLLRGGAKAVNMYGSFLLLNPATALLGVGVLTIGLFANAFAEYIDETSTSNSLRNSLIDVMTSSVPGGFTKDTIVDIGKATLDHFAGD